MAGEGDAERLVVLLEARIRDFEKNMAKASGTATKSYAGMRRDSKTATDRMETDMRNSTGSINKVLAATSTRIGDFGKTMVTTFAASLIAGGVAGIVSRIGNIASSMAEVGDEARRAGLSFKAFQELKYVAEQNRVGVDALTDGMKELALRADEFIVTGGGSAAEAFQRLGYGADELNTKLQDPSALFTEIIGKLGDLDRAAQIRIADELFGGSGGEQFVQLIAQGEEGIRRTIAEANSLGIIMSEEIIAKAAEVDRKFNMVANTVGTAVKGAIIEAAAALNDFFNDLGQTPSQHFAELRDEAAGVRAEIEQFAISASNAVPVVEEELRAIIIPLLETGEGAAEAKAAIVALGQANPDFAYLAPGLNWLINELVAVTGKANEAAAAVAAVTTDPVGEMPAFGDVQDKFNPKPTTVVGSGRAGGTNEIEQQRKALDNLIAGLEFEKELIGLSAVEQERLNALRAAGSLATEEQRVHIGDLIQTLNDEMLASQIIAANATPFDILGEQMATLDGLLARGALSWEQYGMAASQAQAMAVESTLGSLASMSQMLSSAFEENKALSIATAVLKGGEAVVSSFAAGAKIGGPPLGFAFAGIAAAATAAQIASIASTSSSSKSMSSGGGGGGGGSAPTVQNAPQRQAEPQKVAPMVLEVKGLDKGRDMPLEEVRALLETISAYSKDGPGLDIRIKSP